MTEITIGKETYSVRLTESYMDDLCREFDMDIGCEFANLFWVILTRARDNQRMVGGVYDRYTDGKC